MNELKTPQKLWMSGNSLAISVPKKIAEIMGYKAGGYAEIQWGKFIEAMKKAKKEKSLPELNNEKGLPELE